MPPAGRAPPCTRWGASRPPDPGVTPVNENGSASGLRRLRNRFRLRASCRRRTIPRVSVRKRQSPRSFAFGTQNERLSPSGKIKTFPEGVTGKLTPRLEPPKRRSRHPSHLRKSLKRKGGGLEGGGRNFLEKVSPSPLQSYSITNAIAASVAAGMSPSAKRRTTSKAAGSCLRKASCASGVRRPSTQFTVSAPPCGERPMPRRRR